MMSENLNGKTVSQYQHMSSKGHIYFLFMTKVKLRNGNMSEIYFFSKNPECTSGQPTALPEGYEVNENPRNGFLTLRRAA